MKEDLTTFTKDYLKFIRNKARRDFPNVSVHNLVDFSCILARLNEIHPIHNMTLIGIPCDGGWSYGSYFLDFLEIDNPNMKDFVYLTNEGEHELIGEKPNLFKKFTIEPSRMAYWQVCLLEDTWRFLPLVQHSNYSVIKYILCKEDLMKEVSHSIELTNQAKSLKCNFAPRISLDTKGATVSFYLWSDWGGLARATIHYKNEKGHISRVDCHTKRILEYNCGICF